MVSTKVVRSIYGLCDPLENFKVRYVGCTVQKLENRLQAHINEACKSEDEITAKIDWIKALVRQNLYPVILLIEKVPVGADWEDAEKRWIATFPDLLNATIGGIGQRLMTEEIKAKISKSLTGKKQSEETKEKRKLALSALGYKHSDEVRQKISESKQRLKAAGGYKPNTEAQKQKIREALSKLVWVNDGSSNRRVQVDQIPQGWERGRKSISS